MDNRYRNPESEYGKLIRKLAEKWGRSQPAIHTVFPMYTFAGGFYPSPDSITGLVLTPENAETDAAILRGLIYYYYKDGSV